jgi:mannose-6-phosphate isomerase-like protein (cupin superfamily)
LRVLRLDLAPGAGTQLDQHPHDYLVMALTAGAVEFANSVSSQHLDLQPEELQIVTGRWAHRTTNKGSSPLALIEIEFTHDLDPQHALCGLNKPSCKTGEVGNEIGEYTRATLFETATVRVEKDEIEPDAAIPEFYAKRPTLLLAMTPLNLTAASLDEPGKTLDVQKNPGDVLLWPADTNHKLTNSGKDEARFYSIEPR